MKALAVGQANVLEQPYTHTGAPILEHPYTHTGAAIQKFEASTRFFFVVAR